MSDNQFAMSFPAISHEDFPHNVVTNGHVRYCADHGHATHTFDGVESDRCPRCGALHHGDTAEARRESAAEVEEVIANVPVMLDMIREAAALCDDGSNLEYTRGQAELIAYMGGLNGDHVDAIIRMITNK